jgi:hypothetical protein
MTPEERDVIARFVQRVAGSPAGGSVPATAAAPLPPLDPEADQHLANLFQQYPEARYRMTQFAFGQEQALANAAHRMQSMEQQLAAVQQSGVPGQPQAQGGGFFSRLFGAPPGQQQQAPYAQPYQQQGYAQQQPGFGGAPGYQQGYAQQPMMAQRGGSGFLGSAMTTAAGVAGGMLAANAIEGLFSNRSAETGGFGGGGAEQSGWGGGGADQSGWGAGGSDQTGWQTVPDQGAGAADQSGWQDTPDTSAPDDSGGGWDDSGGGGSDWT